MSDMSRSALENGPDWDRDYITFPCQSCNDGRVPTLKFAPRPDVECPECHGELYVEIHRDEFDVDYQPGGESWR